MAAAVLRAACSLTALLAHQKGLLKTVGGRRSIIREWVRVGGAVLSQILEVFVLKDLCDVVTELSLSTMILLVALKKAEN